jgi:hypothetical protein
VFSHKNLVSTVDPSSTVCESCQPHLRERHNSGAVTAKTDEMLYNHAASIRKSGGRLSPTSPGRLLCTLRSDPVLLTSSGHG